MTGDEVLAEVHWLVDGGTHPLTVANMLGRSPESIEKAARVRGEAEFAAWFASACRPRFALEYSTWRTGVRFGTIRG